MTALARRMRYVLRHPFVRGLVLLNGLLFIALLSLLSGHWWPTAAKQQTIHRRIEDTRRTVTLAMQANDLASSYTSAMRTMEVVERKLQAPVKQAQLVQSLAGLARRHGVRIVSETYEEGKRQADYQPLFLQVVLEGRYGSLRSFLGEVSSLPLWVETEEVRLERLREPAGLLKAQLRLRAVRRATATPDA